VKKHGLSDWRVQRPGDEWSRRSKQGGVGRTNA
jgi:hypothetical protein